MDSISGFKREILLIGDPQPCNRIEGAAITDKRPRISVETWR
jgi:hypothetical protein